MDAPGTSLLVGAEVSARSTTCDFVALEPRMRTLNHTSDATRWCARSMTATDALSRSVCVSFTTVASGAGRIPQHLGCVVDAKERSEQSVGRGLSGASHAFLWSTSSDRTTSTSVATSPCTPSRVAGALCARNTARYLTSSTATSRPVSGGSAVAGATRLWDSSGTTQRDCGARRCTSKGSSWGGSCRNQVNLALWE